MYKYSKNIFFEPSSRNLVAVPPDLAYVDSAHLLIQVESLFLKIKMFYTYKIFSIHYSDIYRFYHCI